MINIIAYFKKLLKSNLKWAKLNYCLINLLRKVNKFMANNQFGKKIILLNKKKTYLFTNALSDEFLRKIVIINMISL